MRKFINTFDHFHNVFIYRGLGLGMEEDIINSYNTDYVMAKIRERYLRDSSVTIVMVGRCTWARRYVDWELQSSLRRAETVRPNGLMGIILPSVGAPPRAPERFVRNRFNENGAPAGYARLYSYPTSGSSLVKMIEEAHERRTTHAHLIANPRERFINNKPCP